MHTGPGCDTDARAGISQAQGPWEGDRYSQTCQLNEDLHN